jgi:putative transposase
VTRYRPESVRLRDWDYAAAGGYFVTVCVRGGAHALGSVDAAVLHPSAIGEIVADEWEATARIRPAVRLDEWVLMPNHLHGILILQPERDAPPSAGAPRSSRLQANSLGSIIGQFKAACTRRILAAGHAGFEWQPRFYDRVIRDEREMDRIRKYIRDNPLRWQFEKNNPVGIFM